MKIDLHLHSTVSDGTDTPLELLEKIRHSPIEAFALTDHDDCLGCAMIQHALVPGDPMFIPGIELSAKEGHDKYHILGYAFSADSPTLIELSGKLHDIRIEKTTARLDWLRETYGITFPAEEVDRLLDQFNPGKPHIARLLVSHGYAASISEGITNYLNPCRLSFRRLGPGEAISAILEAGGIPVLAHGIYGSGSQHLSADELESRIRHLKDLGLQGVECWYSRYTPEEQALTRQLCSSYGLLATAGSDYHGKNKTVAIGENHLDDAQEDQDVMRFIEACQQK